jgi:hypothetical protein
LHGHKTYFFAGFQAAGQAVLVGQASQQAQLQVKQNFIQSKIIVTVDEDDDIFVHL